jgi:hypothetical protein
MHEALVEVRPLLTLLSYAPSKFFLLTSELTSYTELNQAVAFFKCEEFLKHNHPWSIDDSRFVLLVVLIVKYTLKHFVQVTSLEG